MQVQLSEDVWLVCGQVMTEPKYTRGEGEKKYKRCSASLITGTGPNPDDLAETITYWCEVVAWNGLANALRYADKWDRVLAVGQWEEYERDGQKRKNLRAEFLSVTPVRKSAYKLMREAKKASRSKKTSAEEDELEQESDETVKQETPRKQETTPNIPVVPETQVAPTPLELSELPELGYGDELDELIALNGGLPF